MSEVENVPIPSGVYYIRNEQFPAGRNRLEDKSLNPKRVLCPPDGGLELWQIERLSNGRYKLFTRRSPTGVINKLLFAFLIEPERAEEWIITKEEGPRGLYIIEKADKSAGWVRQAADNAQIAVRPLIVLPTFPPQYLPNELWSIVPLVD